MLPCSTAQKDGRQRLSPGGSRLEVSLSSRPFPSGSRSQNISADAFSSACFPSSHCPTEPSHGCPPWHLGAPGPLGTSGMNYRWKTHALGLPQRPSPGVLPANIRGCWGRLWVFGYFGVLARWLAMEELSSWNARTAFLNSKMVMIHKGNC